MRGGAGWLHKEPIRRAAHRKVGYAWANLGYGREIFLPSSQRKKVTAEEKERIQKEGRHTACLVGDRHGKLPTIPNRGKVWEPGAHKPPQNRTPPPPPTKNRWKKEEEPKSEKKPSLNGGLWGRREGRAPAAQHRHSGIHSTRHRHRRHTQNEE